MLTFYYANGAKQVVRPSKEFMNGNVDQKCRDFAHDKGAVKYSLNKVIDFGVKEELYWVPRDKKRLKQYKADYTKRVQVENYVPKTTKYTANGIVN